MQLGNHLGNVLVMISDRKKGVADPLSAALIKFFEPVMLSGTDYYPFGMPMRVGGDSSYRYGFNGKENDNEVKGGDGLQQDYGMRVYDNRLGRFLSVDPTTAEYPELTPYEFASNSPVASIDLDGLEKYYFNLAIDEKTKKPVLTLTSKVDSYKDVDGKTVTFNDIDYIVTFNNNTYTFNTNPILAGDFGVAPVNTIDNFQQWYYQPMSGQDVGPFDDIFYSRREAAGILIDEILTEWAVGLAGLKATEPQGTIYKVPGSATTSGKDYIGRHNQENPAKTRK